MSDTSCSALRFSGDEWSVWIGMLEVYVLQPPYLKWSTLITLFPIDQVGCALFWSRSVHGIFRSCLNDDEV